MRRIGTVRELWRYPVKSMRGEPLAAATFDAAGMVGDRRFAVVSSAAPAGKPLMSSRERTAMLRYRPTLAPRREVITPEGRALALPSPELLRELQQQLAAPAATLRIVGSPAQPLTDVRPIALVSVATLLGLCEEFGRFVDPQRFRSNLILALDDHRAFAEDELAELRLGFGEPGSEAGPVLRVQERIPRCRMVSLDPDTTEADPGLLRLLAQKHQGRLGIYASVLRRGALHVNDAVFIE